MPASPLSGIPGQLEAVGAGPPLHRPGHLPLRGSQLPQVSGDQGKLRVTALLFGCASSYVGKESFNVIILRFPGTKLIFDSLSLYLAAGLFGGAIVSW